MNTHLYIKKYVQHDKAVITEAAVKKSEEEEYIFERISDGHYSARTKTDTYLIIDDGVRIGCSCKAMEFAKGNNVCKHIAAFIGLNTTPQESVADSVIEKLIIMGWLGGKGSLHPPTDAPAPQSTPPDEPEAVPAQKKTYTCQICGTEYDSATGVLDCINRHQDATPEPEPAPNTVPEPEPDPVPEPEPKPDPEPVHVPVPEPGGPDEDEDEAMAVRSGGSAVLPPTGLSPLIQAMSRMQSNALEAAADSKNPFHNAKYADLSSVWDAIRKPLTDNGLAVIQTTEPYDDGITVVTTLYHISGESITTRLSSTVPQSKPDKNGQIKPNIQGLGSAITYLRRYSLAALVGVCPVDDDGEAGMGR